MSDVRKLVIDRKRWLRGEGFGELLRLTDGKMCCLGFYGLACGIPPDRMSDLGEPESCPQGWPEWILSDDDGDTVNTRACGLLIESNDSATLIDAERESRIAAIFAEHGVEVTFVDEPEVKP